METRHNHWDVEGIQAALGAETGLTPAPEIMGIRYQTPLVTIDTWPEQRRVTVTTPNTLHWFREVEHSGITDEGRVIFRSTDPEHAALIGVSPRGEVDIFVARGPEIPQPTLEEAIVASCQTPEPSAPEPAALPVSETKEKSDRFLRVGRLVREPAYRETKGGKPICNFVLAEATPDGKPVYHKIYSTGERAKKFKSLEKGAMVEVHGYIQEQPAKPDDPNSKPTQRIYAVAVRSR